MRIHEDEKTLEGLLGESAAVKFVRSLPGTGPILAAVVVTDIDSIERFPSAQKLCGCAGLCPSTHSSGGKTFQGKLLPHCNKWLRSRLNRDRLGCHRLLGLLRGLLQTQASAWQEPTIAILATARLMARITWQLLAQPQGYTSLVETQYLRSQPAQRIPCAVGLTKEVQETAQRSFRFPSGEDFPQPLR